MAKTDVLSLGALSPAVFHILLALADGPLHGYAIMRSMTETGGPQIPAGASTVYGSLGRLKRRGLVEESRASSGDTVGTSPRRRVYVLTSRGRLALEHEATRLVQAVELLRARGLVPRTTKSIRMKDVSR